MPLTTLDSNTALIIVDLQKGMRCPSNFAFQMAALTPPWMADRHAC